MPQTFDPKKEILKLREMFDFLVKKTLTPEQLADFQERFPIDQEVAEEKPAQDFTDVMNVFGHM